MRPVPGRFHTAGEVTLPDYTEVYPPVDSAINPQAQPGPRRKTTQLLAAGLVAAGVLLAACSSSSTPATTTTAPPGGKLSSNNAAYIASDLKAPAGALTAAGSTFVQPFFTVAFHQYTSLQPGTAGQLLGRGQW